MVHVSRYGAYPCNKFVVELTKPELGIFETFFPLRGRLPSDQFSRIMCVGLVLDHFVYVQLKNE
jgi:hypothetical protein